MSSEHDRHRLEDILSIPRVPDKMWDLHARCAAASRRLVGCPKISLAPAARAGTFGVQSRISILICALSFPINGAVGQHSALILDNRMGRISAPTCHQQGSHTGEGANACILLKKREARRRGRLAAQFCESGDDVRLRCGE